MKDLEIEALVDLARGLLPPAERRELEAKLAVSKTARQRRELLRQIVDFARAERAHQAPPEVVRRARAIFQPAGPETPARWRTLAATLLLDSVGEPLPAGVRSLETAGRQSVYGVQDYRIHLQREPTSSGRVTCVGQITSAGPPRERLAGLSVQVRSGRKLLAETKTNPFGEFELHYRAAPALTLMIPLPELRRRLVIQLDEEEKTGAADRSRGG